MFYFHSPLVLLLLILFLTIQKYNLKLFIIIYVINIDLSVQKLHVKNSANWSYFFLLLFTFNHTKTQWEIHYFLVIKTLHISNLKYKFHISLVNLYEFSKKTSLKNTWIWCWTLFVEFKQLKCTLFCFHLSSLQICCVVHLHFVRIHLLFSLNF